MFRIDGKYQSSTPIDGGAVDVIHQASGDKLKYVEDVAYDWDPGLRRLTVTITYPADERALNLVKRWGTYNVRGKSVTQVTTSSVDAESGFSFAAPATFGVNASVTKTQARRTSRLKVLVDGSPYWSLQGLFSIDKRTPSQTVFVTGMDWFTDALINYQEQVEILCRMRRSAQTQWLGDVQCAADERKGHRGEQIGGGVQDLRRGSRCPAVVAGG